MEKEKNNENFGGGEKLTVVEGKDYCLDFSDIHVKWTMQEHKYYLGCCARLTNEYDFMDRTGIRSVLETEAFVQALGAKMRKSYEEKRVIATFEMVDYKKFGDYWFKLNRVEVLETYGGYFVVGWYDFDTSAS